MNHSIQEKHFAEWIRVWDETIDDHFEGIVANKAKEAARRMAIAQFTAIRSRRSFE